MRTFPGTCDLYSRIYACPENTVFELVRPSLSSVSYVNVRLEIKHFVHFYHIQLSNFLSHWCIVKQHPVDTALSDL